MLIIILEIVWCASLLWYRRGVMRFSKGYEAFRHNDREKAFELFDSALKAHLDPESRISIANFNLQFGDIHKALSIVEGMLANGKNLTDRQRFLASMMKGVILYSEGEVDEALNILNAIREEGFREPALYGNMMIIAMDEENRDMARQLWEEAKELHGQDLALDDSYIRLLILEKRWDKALREAQKLENNQLVAASQMLHTAQIYNHFGMVEQAVLYFRKASECVFNNISRFDKAYCTDLADGLNNPKTRLAFAHTIEENRKAIAKGTEYRITESLYPECEDTLLLGFDDPYTQKPRTEKSREIEKEKREKDLERKQERDREPDTSITEEDEKYLEELK